jgi:hypothetical protein
VPRFVGEVGVGAYRVDFDSELLKGVIFIGHVAQFGGANESEVGRIEEKHRPLSAKVVLSHGFESAIMERFGFEIRDPGINQSRHNEFSFMCFTMR